MIVFQTWDTRTCEAVSVRVDGDSQDAYLGLVLDLHLRGSEELGVNPLWHPRVDLLPPRAITATRLLNDDVWKKYDWANVQPKMSSQSEIDAMRALRVSYGYEAVKVWEEIR